jgi:nitrite reductase/ring-hydroxylating ferredoxin subunit/Fe-S cluster biogenesis protein NfuA
MDEERVDAPGPDIDTLLDRLAYTEERIAAKAQKWEVEAYRGALDKLHGEALRRLVGVLRRDDGAADLLQAAAADEVVYTVLRRHEIITPPIEERVAKALRKIRPLLATHGGDIDVIAIAPPRITLRFVGSCEECPAQLFTLRSVIASALKRDCPEIRELVEMKATGAGEAPVRLENEGWRPAGLLSEIPEGGARDLVVDREELLLVRRGDAVSCFAAYCPHRGISVDSRDIEADGILTCYRHGYRFDLATGDCLSFPGLKLESHEVKIAEGRVMVRMRVRG